MKTNRPFKVWAGAGLVTMLLGALLVLAPSAGADHLGPVPPDAELLPAGGGRVPICHATASHEKPYVRNTPSFNATGGPSANHHSHDGDVYAGPETETWGDIIPPVAVDGHLVYAGSDNWLEGGSELYATCSGQAAPVLFIEKVVPGDPADTTEFEFGVTQGDQDVAFAGAGDDKIAEGETLEAALVAGEVVITETATLGYTLSDVSCVRDYVDETDELVEDEVVTVDDDLDAGTATFTAVDGDTITCTFTNDLDTGSQTGSVRIDKVVAGTAAGAQPADRKFGFTAVCEDAAQDALVLDAEDASFELTNSGDRKVIDELPAGATCTIEETVRHSPNGTTVKVGTAAAVSASKAEDVTVVAGQITDVVVTNIYNASEIIVPPTTTPPAPASLRLNKAVESVGGGEGPETWAAQFEVLGEDVEESRTLDQDVTTARLGGLDAGSYTITELAEEGSTLTDVDCVERDGADVDVDVLPAGVAVVLDAGENVVCTFTNTYPAVLPNEEEPKPAEETPKPKPEPPTVVLGDVVTRPQTLPRTGDETKGLAGVGVLLVALGAAMVLGSKRQLARR